MEERSFYRTSLLKRLHENGCRLREEEILSAFSYNLDKYNQEADGIAILTKSELILWEGTAVKESYALSSIDKFVFRVDIGSVAVECLWKENNKPRQYGASENIRTYGQ